MIKIKEKLKSILTDMKNRFDRLKKNENFKIFVIPSTIVVGLLIVFAIVLLLTPKAPVPGHKTFATPTPSPIPYKQTTWTIMVTKDIFVPRTMTIPTGGQLNFINFAQKDISILSSDNPVYLPLNIGTITFGQMKSVVMDKPGTYNYVNQLNTKEAGVIIVK